MVRDEARLVVAWDAATRLDAAANWLSAQPPDSEVLVIGPSWHACDDLVRAVTQAQGGRFGTVRLTLDRVAARLALGELAGGGRAQASGLSMTAIVARAVHRLLADQRLPYFAPVATRPGFPHAVTRTLQELRMNAVAAAVLRALPSGGRDLAEIAEAVDHELAQVGLADRAIVFEAARRVADREPAFHPVGLPLLLLDLPVEHALEATLITSLAGRAPAALATVPTGDLRAIERLEAALSCRAERIEGPQSAAALPILKKHLFEDSKPAPERSTEA